MRDMTMFPLRAGRVHEVCGPSAIGFAAVAAAQTASGVLYIRERWHTEQIHPSGLGAILPPERVLLARPANHTDALAVAEEALKDGVLPFVIIGISQPLNLREGRRLQLAAKAGGTTGLCLIAQNMGSNAAETRWRASPVFDRAYADSTLMRWEIIKNKSGTNGAWHVRWDAERHCMHVVCPAPE
ncbi:hypothetical protein ERN12_13165 [Rhodobacteraceae bacterium]|nr:hypothetical protein ERN12_13165 [Paracoccaceae bacterium]